MHHAITPLLTIEENEEKEGGGGMEGGGKGRRNGKKGKDWEKRLMSNSLKSDDFKTVPNSWVVSQVLIAFKVVTWDK